MNIKKPNSFARYGSDYVAPLTTIDQIVKPSGERYTGREFELMSNVENVMFGESGAGKNLADWSKASHTIYNYGTGIIETLANYYGVLEHFETKGQKLTLSFDITSNVQNPWCAITLYDENKNYIRNVSGYVQELSVIPNSNEKYATFALYSSNISLSKDDYYNVQLEYGDRTSYEPYVKSLKQLTDSALNMDLLWTNANPTSEFLPQTISLDLSNYKSVLIRFDMGITDSSSSYYRVHTYSLFLKNNTKTYTPCFNISSLENNKVIYREILSIDDSGIRFGNGKLAAMDGDWRNQIMIPTEIYGVR